MLFDTTQLALERAIGGAAQRHAALAANLANVNTPGYQRVDVDFHGALRSALEQGGNTRAAVERATFSAERDGMAVTRADGNGVDADADAERGLLELGAYGELVGVPDPGAAAAAAAAPAEPEAPGTPLAAAIPPLSLRP